MSVVRRLLFALLVVRGLAESTTLLNEEVDRVRGLGLSKNVMRRRRHQKMMGRKGAKKGGRKGHHHNNNRTPFCNPVCPCCDRAAWPEFVAAIESYSEGDACFIRNDAANGELVAAINCNPYQVAYMSYDYSGFFDGDKYCGDSSSPRRFLNDAQAVICTNVVHSAISGGNCSTTFGDCA